ncbi:MAG: dienelactone hydrolase family protein [Candidatus Omnitrophica bacterium]|nr:dienelactone hydrolase family protein [Candidatus Omnitrophota bacterium]
MKLFKHGILFLLILICLPGRVKAGEIQISKDVKGYLSLPQAGSEKSSAPGIILIHEWWGLNDQTKEMADKFAVNGFAALAVDLYRGSAAKDPAEAHELMRGLPDDRAYSDLKDALTYFQGVKTVDSKRIGIIGWCMGGGYALEFGVRDDRIKAVVMYYGKIITDDKRLENFNAPLLGIFGGQDRGITAASVEDFKFRLEQLHKRAEIYSYPEAGHAFANPVNPGYRKADADDAWHKTVIFLKANLV